MALARRARQNFAVLTPRRGVTHDAVLARARLARAHTFPARPLAGHSTARTRACRRRARGRAFASVPASPPGAAAIDRGETDRPSRAGVVVFPPPRVVGIVLPFIVTPLLHHASLKQCNARWGSDVFARQEAGAGYGLGYGLSSPPFVAALAAVGAALLGFCVACGLVYGF